MGQSQWLDIDLEPLDGPQDRRITPEALREPPKGRGARRAGRFLLLKR